MGIKDDSASATANVGAVSTERKEMSLSMASPKTLIAGT